ncbi:MAG TPA: hypothetical protein VKW04_14320 [Planctomycetota bacterium]|nr:hypothetical protein [Planctomycetota bacterium]
MAFRKARPWALGLALILVPAGFAFPLVPGGPRLSLWGLPLGLAALAILSLLLGLAVQGVVSAGHRWTGPRQLAGTSRKPRFGARVVEDGVRILVALLGMMAFGTLFRLAVWGLLLLRRP